MSELKELRQLIRQIINESTNESQFKIPEEIKQFYKISGDFSNVKNWEARIIAGNSKREGQKKGDWDKVGYVLISLTSNYIIPVARADEHHTGYDLLEDLIRKYKIKDLKYQSVFLLGNHYVYGGQYQNDEFQAIKKAYEYGARDIMVKEMGGGRKYLDIDDYVANGGDFNQAIKVGKELKKVSGQGQKFINELKSVTKLFETYSMLSPRGTNS